MLQLGDTDTGPTHLAALLRTPTILFRNNKETLSPDMLKHCIVPIAKREKFYAHIIENGWDEPAAIIDAAVEYLT